MSTTTKSTVPRPAAKTLVGIELLFAHLPDPICLYRALASIVTVLLGQHPAAPWLFSTALISDLLDGYFYRHYTQYHPKLSKRPYRPCDPWADFVLILSGTIYTARYWLQLDWWGVVQVLAFVSIIAGILHVIPYLGPPSRLVYTVCTTFMTHISCFVMVASAVFVWRVNTASRLGPIATVAVFYLIFGLIGEKSRLIRRPPVGWRGLS